MDKKKSRQVHVTTDEGTRVIPVLREELEVSKRSVETGVTRVRKLVREREEVVDEPLLRDKVQVDRVPINRFVDEPVAVRQEDGATIIPVMEEVLVVEKRLLLKEELHIRKLTETVREPQTVLLHSEEAVVDHVDTRERTEKPNR